MVKGRKGIRGQERAAVSRRIFAILGLCLVAGALSGCATAVVGGITVGEITTAAGIASVGTTGKGLPDHALSAMTGKDCRLLEGIFRKNRRICEEPGSPATEHDFRGVVALLRGDAGDQADQQVAEAGDPLAPPVLVRTERQTGSNAEPEAPTELAGPLTAPVVPHVPAVAELPTATEWASLRPPPALMPSRWDGR
jgi:hypothetical protein